MSSKHLFVVLYVLFLCCLVVCQTEELGTDEQIVNEWEENLSESKSSVKSGKCSGVFGPSNTNGETVNLENKDKCRLCTIDCNKIWLFATKYSSSWYDNRPQSDQVVQDSSCECRYYNYGM